MASQHNQQSTRPSRKQRRGQGKKTPSPSVSWLTSPTNPALFETPRNVLILGSSHTTFWPGAEAPGRPKRPTWINPEAAGYTFVNFSRGGRTAGRLWRSIMSGVFPAHDGRARREHQDFMALAHNYYAVIICVGGNDFQAGGADSQLQKGWEVAKSSIAPAAKFFLTNGERWLWRGNREGRVYVVLPPPRDLERYPGHDVYLRGLHHGLRAHCLPGVVHRIEGLYASETSYAAADLVQHTDGVHLSIDGNGILRSGVLRLALREQFGQRR